MATSVEHTRPLPRTRTRSRGRFFHLVAVLHRWAESGWAGPATGTWTFFQSSVVPGPSDLLLIPLGLSDPPRVYRLAGWSIVGSTLGALVAFAIGALAFDTAQPLLGWIGISAAEVEATRTLFERYGWMFVFISAVTPVSTKIVCIAAGALGVPLPHFFFAILAGRATRFLAVATLVRFAGERLVAKLEKRAGRPIETWR